jgi:Tfp pilus assembly protein FimT
METVTVAATRGFTVADMEMLIGSAIVIAVMTWFVFARFRALRSRQEPPHR